MDFFWGNVFEYFKERRLAGFFFGTVLVFVGLLIGGVCLCRLIGAGNLQNGLEYSSPVLALIFIAWVWRGIVRVRQRRRNRYKISPLSRDELSKARSKLRAKR